MRADNSLKTPKLLTVEERIEIYKKVIKLIKSYPNYPFICCRIKSILSIKNEEWRNHIKNNYPDESLFGDHFFGKYFPEFLENKPLKLNSYTGYTDRPWWSAYDYKSRIDYLKKLIQLLEDQNNE